MRKYILIIITLLFTSHAFTHNAHYEGLKKIEMDILLNGEVIGYSNYFFERDEDSMTVKNYTKFKVDLFGIKIFSILSETTEKYKNDQLIFFKSNTFQNDKEKYVNLNYSEELKKFIIDGSSYKGDSDLDCVIGSWWNHKILQVDCQISPLSGSIKYQTIEFIGKKKINLYGNEFEVDHFKLKSTDPNIDENKKLDFDIWYDKEKAVIVKISYKKLGDWEYRLKSLK